nr:penicillin-binding protein 2 [Herbihabitans rhizosphaerae]
MRLSRRPQAHDHRKRVVVMRLLLIVPLVAALLQLVNVQGFKAGALAELASKQRSTEIELPASRGSITDRNGVQLAFSVESRALSYRPQAERAKYADKPGGYDARAAEIVAYLKQLLGDKVNEKEMLDKLRSDVTFTYLVNNGVEPAQARAITERFPEVIADYRATREYPGKSLAANIVGLANWRTDDPNPHKHNLHGLIGLENSRDNVLTGEPGRQVVDTAEGKDGVVIPGTARELQHATDGSDLELTIDADLQYDLQQRLTGYVERSGAKGGSAVIMDAKTGEVYALANDKTFDPTAGQFRDPKTMGNPAVTTPYEPGSVNKLVTAAAAIEAGVTTPEAVTPVPGTLRVADHVMHDAWPHGTQNFTTAGIFGKSSNIGTLLMARKVGEDRFSEVLKKFGLGERTGVGLPGEAPGSVPPRGQWSGTTFANLPIGQGLSMTVLQMAGMYQAIANDGVRVPPRIVRAQVKPDGTRVAEERPEGVRVVTEQTARTVRDMFRAVVQKAPGQNSGTGPAAAVAGYQISGKTGTAQQPDPATGRYSDSKYWITFAGILPADNPRFVVGIMLDAPNYGGPDGRSAAPLFHDVASFLAQRYNIPLSAVPSPVVPLVQ